MSITSKFNRTERQLADQRMIDGLNKHAAIMPSFVIGGAPVTPAEMIATLQGRLATATAAQSARAAWLATVEDDRAELENTKARVAAFRQVVTAAFAGSIDSLADFGMAPPRQPVVSPEKRVEAIAKGKATREARGTLGKKQRLAIKGTVPPAPTTA